MSSSFKFKQFEIFHDKCAQKVGTDSVLLGAWTELNNCENVLDIGCGSGILSLMLAQKNPKTNFTGIEIDENAANQAQQNFDHSPWSDRLISVHGDVNSFQFQSKFDHIISNPPFFKNALISSDSDRTLARHQKTLSVPQIIYLSSKTLNNNGLISIVIPSDQYNEVVRTAESVDMTVKRVNFVKPSIDKEPNRILVTLSKLNCKTTRESMVIYDQDSKYTKEFKSLTKEFYLNF